MKSQFKSINCKAELSGTALPLGLSENLYCNLCILLLPAALEGMKCPAGQ